MYIKIINGPNLNMLGQRQPEIYGNISFDTYLQTLRKSYPMLRLDCFQSNHEGAIIDEIQNLKCEGLVINPAAYTHTSIAIADSLAFLTIPVIEVHISDIYKRETFRHHSYISPHVLKTIVGQGLKGYDLAIDSLLKHLQEF